jgi:uncharacterized phage protein gp47/JayE
MAFGVNEYGFEIKRLQDIVAELKARAAVVFGDLLEPGDVVDTSDSSSIGRFINTFSLADTTLWEQMQLVYSAFDPNSAIGVALDNIVQYGGITRQPPSYSTVTALFSGDNGVSIPASSVIGSNIHPNTFANIGLVPLTPQNASGIDVEVFTVQNATQYSITYSISLVSTNTVTYTSDGSATVGEILAGLKTNIDSAHPLLVATIADNRLVIRKSDIFQTSTFTISSNLAIIKVSKLATLRAEEFGELSAEANSLNVIKTPVLGWDSVTNPVAASEGRLTESDEDLRLRFRNTKFERSTNILDSLYSALLSVDSVESVAVYDNDTDVVDSNGLPPHSFTAIVLGGEPTDIANTIWRNKPVGITSNGNTSVTIIDSQDFPREIRFERPSPITIYISMDLDKDALYPADGDDQIRSAIISYAKDNFSVGDDIVQSRLYTPINSIPGHSINYLYISTSPSPVSSDNIDIAFNEIGSFQSINIEIV